MRLRKYNKSLGWLSSIAGTILLSGCNSTLLGPKGQTGLKQRSLILTTFGLMLTVVIPAILMAVDFAWKYRVSDKDTKYSPSRSHSNKMEAVAWTVSILTIIFLVILTWKTTHALEPSKPSVHDEKPITIEMVPMDWKWFFICPEQGIATVSEIVFPANIPVEFKVTSNSVMNSFFILRLSSQIYAVAGMQTRLHLIANEVSIYDSISTSYNGPGLSGMKFKVIAIKDRAEFDRQIAKAKQSTNTMSNMAAFEKAAALSEYNQVEYFSNMEPDLFEDVINEFMARGKGMDVSRPEGKHGAHERMEGMNMSHAESAYQGTKEEYDVRKIDAGRNSVP